jgi:hypothetical protein
MITLANIGDDSNGAFVVAEALAQHTAARRFEYRSLYVRMSQYIARTLRAATVTAIGLTSTYKYAIGVSHANA